MCQFTVGQQVSWSGRIFCKACGQVLRIGWNGTFIGHDSGFDVFELDSPALCPWCGASNPACEMPCNDPITSDLFQVNELVTEQAQSSSSV